MMKENRPPQISRELQDLREQVRAVIQREKLRLDYSVGIGPTSGEIILRLYTPGQKLPMITTRARDWLSHYPPEARVSGQGTLIDGCFGIRKRVKAARAEDARAKERARKAEAEYRDFAAAATQRRAAVEELDKEIADRVAYAKGMADPAVHREFGMQLRELRRQAAVTRAELETLRTVDRLTPDTSVSLAVEVEFLEETALVFREALADGPLSASGQVIDLKPS